MIEKIEQIVNLFEQKKIDRRQLVGALLVVAAAPAPTADAAAPMFSGRTINHVTILGTDLKRSRAFYERLVGAQVMYDGGRFYDMRLSGGNSFISIAQAPTPRIDHVCIGVVNFDADRTEAMIR